MTNRQKAAILRRVARAIEKEWVRQGQPIHTPFYPTNPLAADARVLWLYVVAHAVAEGRA